MSSYQKYNRWSLSLLCNHRLLTKVPSQLSMVNGEWRQWIWQIHHPRMKFDGDDNRSTMTTMRDERFRGTNMKNERLWRGQNCTFTSISMENNEIPSTIWNNESVQTIKQLDSNSQLLLATKQMFYLQRMRVLFN